MDFANYLILRYMNLRYSDKPSAFTKVLKSGRKAKESVSEGRDVGKTQRAMAGFEDGGRDPGKGKKMNSSLEPQRGTGGCAHHDFSPEARLGPLASRVYC